MRNNQTLQAKVLTVNTVELNLHEMDGTSGESCFNVYEFPNGLVLVEGYNTNDWFFENRDAIEACGTAVVSSIEETGRTEDFTAESLLKSVQGSIKEFGVDAVPSKHRELWGKVACNG